MGGIPPFLLDQMGQDVTFEPYRGTSGTGVVLYDVPIVKRSLVDATRRFVRNANGEQVVSETTIMADLDLDCPPKSRVTVPGNDPTTVITVSKVDGGTLPVPSHLEIALQ